MGVVSDASEEPLPERQCFCIEERDANSVEDCSPQLENAAESS